MHQGDATGRGEAPCAPPAAAGQAADVRATWLDRMREANPENAVERADPRVDATRALRRLMHQVVAPGASPEQLRALAARMAELADASGITEATSRYAGDEGPLAVATRADTCAIRGSASPLGTPLDLRWEGERLVAAVRFGPLFEGTPGVVHGGMVAATFDQLFGSVAVAVGRPAVTGTLTVRYVAPTPLGTDLVFECWMGETQGRKVHAHGRARCGPAVTAEAHAVFVTIDDGRYGAVPRQAPLTGL